MYIPIEIGIVLKSSRKENTQEIYMCSDLVGRHTIFSKPPQLFQGAHEAHQQIHTHSYPNRPKVMAKSYEPGSAWTLDFISTLE